jgi:hypothetical protein
MSAWSHLPNAKHIDRVIATLKKHTEIWGEAYDAAGYSAWYSYFVAARDVARLATPDAAWVAARDEIFVAARGTAWVAVWTAGNGVAWDAIQGAIIALIAYDDCEQYLSMTSEELQVWARLSENPAAVLLLPAVVVFERIAELETV